MTSFLKQHHAESICFVLFTLLACIGFCTHEMWYDEAQAWQIARTAPLKDIIFLIPHWEGHPPFWHLLLAIPAKLGLPWNWGVGLVGMLFMLANGFLIFFKAPFPRWVRCLLPFNYFLFYQYGIIVRPYSAILLVMLLLAVYFPQKDKRSTLYIGLLAALCACHIFGIALAGGITIAWLWELKNHRPWKEYIPALCKDGRFYKMLLLLGFVIVLFAGMRQTDGVLDAYLAYTPHLFKQVLYVLFALPADTVLTNLGDPLYIMTANLPWAGLLVTCLLGLLLWAGMLFFLPRKYLLYLVLPYICVGGVLLHYCSRHHIGVLLVLFIWYAWITLQKFPLSSHIPHELKRLAQLLLGLALAVPALWTAYGMYLDYKLVFFPGKQVVEFLEKYNLTNKTIFASWEIKLSANQIFWSDPNFMPTATMLNVYMPYNMIANFNNGSSQTYNINTMTTPEERTRITDYWHSQGLPDVLLGPVALPMVFNDDEVIKKYRAAWVSFTYIPWKFNRPKQEDYAIYLREDVWNELKNQVMADARTQP